MVRWLGQADPQEWPSGRTAGGQLAWEGARAYRGLLRLRQLLGPRLLGPLLGPGRVLLGSSLDAAGAPPGAAARAVAGQKHAGQGRGDSGSPTHDAERPEGPPRSPFLLRMEKLRPRQEVGSATVGGPAWHSAGQPRVPDVYSWCMALAAEVSVPESFSEEPQECPTATPAAACGRLAQACRQGLAGPGAYAQGPGHGPQGEGAQQKGGGQGQGGREGRGKGNDG